MKKLLTALFFCTFPLLALAVEHTVVSTERLVNADQENANWLSHGRTYDESRFSPLKQINKETVKDLGLAWSFEYGDKRGLQATPIVVDGVIYTTAAWSKVYAHNAKTGELLWSFDPKVDKAWLVRACCGPMNRGVAVWQDKVFVGTLDGYLVAIDRATGKQAWRTLTIDPEGDYTITGAPRIVKGQVVIGNGGAEYGVRGYVSAYDAQSGELNWRFYTVPGNPAEEFENDAMEAAAKTWKGEWWKIGGGGTVWDSMSYDPALNLLYIGVGNGSPWNQEVRSPGGGDNLYLSSIVALNPDTGEYVWHYQSTPGESWDFTATQQIVLADIEWEGEIRKVLMQAPKNGFFFIVDRVTGEFLSAEPFTKVLWATGYDAYGRPIEVEGARYKTEPMMMVPTAAGGHNWHSMSYSAQAGLVYIPVIMGMMPYAQPKEFEYKPHHYNTGVDASADVVINQYFVQVIKQKAIRGELLAWNPQKQKAEWSYTHATSWNGGVLSTAGDVVFQGTADQKFMAFDANNGEVLWEFDSQLGIIAAPVSYSVDGEQYVAVVAKWGGAFAMAVGIAPQKGLLNGRLLVFKLGAKESLPPSDIPVLTMAKKPVPMTINDEAVIEEGRLMFIDYCAACHGNDVISSGNVPDLRYRSSQYDFEAFKVFVLDGVLADRGMVSFADILDETSANKIYNYILQEASYEYEKTQQQGPMQDLEYWFYDILADFFLEAADGTPRFYIGIIVFWGSIIGLIVFFWKRRK